MSVKIKHPAFHEILEFRCGGPGSVSATEVGEHIATCERCHVIYRGVLFLEDRIVEEFRRGNLSPKPSCPEDWEIAALMAKETSGDAAVRVSSHIQSCSFCIDQAAQYHKAFATTPLGVKTPEVWKKAAVSVLREDTKRALELRSTLLAGIQDMLKRVVAQIPPLPRYVAAVLVIIMIAWLYTGDRTKMVIIPSTEKVAIRETDPTGTMGFMGQEETRQLVKGMTLRVSGNGVVFRWTHFHGASGFSFSLIEKSGGTVLWSRTDAKGNEVTVPKHLFAGDKVYTWKIEAMSPEGRNIVYTGEFLYAD
jgi:hypothetical protein